MSPVLCTSDYKLSILQASRLLKDSSLGQPIELVVKKLVVLEEHDPSLKIVPNVALSAKRFIRWKNKYQKQIDDSYDLALLLTRYTTVVVWQSHPNLLNETS